MNNAQNNNVMQNIIVTANTLATETADQRAARIAEFNARCAPSYAAYNRGVRNTQTIAAKKAVLDATRKYNAIR
jgi:hypothetical protein